MKILFICKYNAFRSRISEEYFKKVNKNPKVEAISRGFIMDTDSDSEQKRLSKQLLGIDISKRKPLPITLNDLIKSDLIIVAADDIPKIMFNYPLVNIQKKIIFWKIKDEQRQNKENIKRIILQIKKKIDKLNQQLEKKK